MRGFLCSDVQVIAMCEQKAGNEAAVTKVPLLSLKALEFVTGFFQWTRDASDRLAFANVLTNNEVFSAPMDETYEMLGLDPADTTTLEQYMDDYFGRILKKLKEVGGKSRQKDLYVHIPPPPTPSPLFALLQAPTRPPLSER